MTQVSVCTSKHVSPEGTVCANAGTFFEARCHYDTTNVLDEDGGSVRDACSRCMGGDLADECGMSWEQAAEDCAAFTSLGLAIMFGGTVVVLVLAWALSKAWTRIRKLQAMPDEVLDPAPTMMGVEVAMEFE